MMKKLPVPENIPLRWELFRGFGRVELLRTTVISSAMLVASSIGFGLFTTWNTQTVAAATTMVVLFTITFCVGLFEKMDNNLSIYEFLRLGSRYRKEQQTYWYKREKDVIFDVSEQNKTGQ